jgi:pimeloyl-ACP methyl ester carboxylesterase
MSVRVLGLRKEEYDARPPVNAEYLHERLPHSQLHLIDSCHFAWEDAADEYASLVTAWWAGGYKTRDAGVEVFPFQMGTSVTS